MWIVLFSEATPLGDRVSTILSPIEAFVGLKGSRCRQTFFIVSFECLFARNCNHKLSFFHVMEICEIYIKWAVHDEL